MTDFQEDCSPGMTHGVLHKVDLASPYLSQAFRSSLALLRKDNLALEAELRQAREALSAYASAYPCPGIEIEPGITSGCEGGSDCPTHQALAATQESES